MTDDTSTALAVYPGAEEANEEEAFHEDFFEDAVDGQEVVKPLDYQFTARLKGPPQYKDIKDGLCSIEVTFVSHCASSDVVEAGRVMLEMFANNDPGVQYLVTATPPPPAKTRLPGM